jgi:hypothetical protein
MRTTRFTEEQIVADLSPIQSRASRLYALSSVAGSTR